ncbi:MAG: hypothetical protein IIC55_08185, partial [Proteobacteria bacterium]|nr:hypothetical protein [Pseudomonadota bacterium]
MSNRFRSRRVNLVGGQGSGKTVLAQAIARAFRKALVIDPQDEWPDSETLTAYVPEYTEYGPESVEEMDAVVIFNNVLVPWERVFMYRDPLLCNKAFAETNAVIHMMHQVVCGKLAKAEFIVGLLC